MLTSNGFDLWADSYDQSVQHAEENNQYPFAGYAAIMNAIYGTVMKQAPGKILDIGFGTAVLASRLYEGGNQITGIDFSSEMIKTAQAKMPEACLLQWDFHNGIPPALRNRKFDYIISTYALHHLTDVAQASLITELLGLLEPHGAVLIGDVCFRTRDELLACKAACGTAWDEEEIYIVSSELQTRLKHLCRLSFQEFSFCSGIIEITPAAYPSSYTV